MRTKLAKMGDQSEQLCPGRRVADAVLYLCPLWCGHCSTLLQSLHCYPTCSGWIRCHPHSSSRDTCMAATWPDNILLAITNSLTTMGPYGARSGLWSNYWERKDYFLLCLIHCQAVILGLLVVSLSPCGKVAGVGTRERD